ncbi:hypothetical protein ACVWWG_001868 [Bradyrhizobium sp. LB7.2]
MNANSANQTKDDVDKEPREERSCGRSQTLLYNDTRPHSQLGSRTPSEFALTCHPRRDLALRYAEGSGPAPVAPAAHPGKPQQPGRTQDWIKLGDKVTMFAPRLEEDVSLWWFIDGR